MSVEVIGIIGAGTMGRGIAQIAVVAGYEVRLWDAQADAVTEGCAFVERMIRRSVERGRMEQGAADAALGRLKIADSLEAFAGADIVIEAVVENLEIKRGLFRDLEAVVDEACILASNTSSLSVTSIAANCAHPGRVAGYHFFNPVPLMKVVEVIKAAETRDDVCQTLSAVATRMGHRPVVTQDSPGFLVNHAGRGMPTEGFRIVSEGIADYFAIDRIMRAAAGFRMGPFELMDLTGLDISHAVMESVYNQFYQEPRFRPSHLARQRVEANLLGRKNDRGFYGYQDGKRIDPPLPAAPDKLPERIWMAELAGPAAAVVDKLAGLKGVVVERSEAPGRDTLCLVSPVGADATSTALFLGLDPERTVALDPVFGLDEHRTLMPTSITDPELLAQCHGLMAGDGVPVTVIHDSPGFIAQRMVAVIVNIGCDIAQQRIAAPEDIDAAVTLGLNYPKGPLALGDAIGAATILVILDELHEFYGDPRYRPSPWLKRRARLGVSLLTPES